MTPAPVHDRRILLTGATGYVGGRLLRGLQSTGAPVRCLARSPHPLRDRAAPGTEIVAGDVLRRASLERALEGVHTACYLVHSMGARGDFEELDRRAALNFADAARSAGVAQIVYLGGLGSDEELSPHLASRQEVGRLLRCTGVPTIEFRASIVIGSGSASFETVRALVERLPVILAPPWVRTLAQPIAIEDLIAYLLAATQLRAPRDAIYEIGGRDRVSYAEVMLEYARQRDLRRRLIATPLVTPRLSRTLLGLLTPVYGRVAGTMVESLRNETTVRTGSALSDFAVTPRGVPEAISRALLNEDREFSRTRWSEELDRSRPLRWGGLAYGRRLVSSSSVRVERAPEEAFEPIQRIGGSTGWYAADWFWRLRGHLDRLQGGVGLRRGRRDPLELRVGDAVDFWRVESVESGRLLRLSAEMNIPGRLWLQFEVDPEGSCSTVRQTTVFDPSGFAGLAHWYLFYPLHRGVFKQMLAGIEGTLQARAAHQPAGAHGPGCVR
jgi:uncharacterized protein YbjT (DUF2867 family)